MRHTPQPIDWNALAAGKTPTKADDRITWEERRAIELERLALEDAVRRAILTGTAEVREPYRPPPSILQNRYLPAVLTVLILLVCNYLGQT